MGDKNGAVNMELSAEQLTSIIKTIQELIVNPVVKAIDELKLDINKLYELYKNVTSLDKELDNVKWKVESVKLSLDNISAWKDTHCLEEKDNDIYHNVSVLMDWKKEYEENNLPENKLKNNNLKLAMLLTLLTLISTSITIYTAIKSNTAKIREAQTSSVVIGGNK